MKINIQLKPEDYVRANFLNIRPRPIFKLVGLVFLILTISILGISFFQLLAGKDKTLIPFVIAGCLAYLAFYFGFRLPQRLKKIFRQQKSLHSPYSIEVNDDLIFVKAETGESRLPWNHFIKWKENKPLITLYQSDILLHIIPKRCFASPDELGQFRELLIKKIGQAS